MTRFFVAGSYRSVRFTVITRILGAFLAVGLGMAPPALALDIPTDCLPDSDAANDAAGTRDVTQFCIEAGGNTPYDLDTIVNLDMTTINGAGESDVCMLFNTDGDAFANLAVCITVNGDGVGDAVALEEFRLFTCTDTRADRCSGAVLVAGPYDTLCEVTQESTDPFPGPSPGPGEDYPYDTQILCGVDLDDFVNGAGALPMDTCSYANNNPNSNPSDCVSFQTCTVNGDCDDANPCTIDTCDGTDVCVFSPDEGAPCDDGLFCNGEEACTNFGVCGQGTGGPVDCDDGVGCTQDTCDELGDVCQNDPMNSLCSDGLFCTGVETCDAVNDCQAGTAPDCGDGIACTTDTCDETNDTCDHVGSDASCDNGNFCDGDETCDLSTGCLPGTAPDCGDGIDCTTDTCDESSDDCAHSANDALCSDALYCTGEETCVVGIGCAVGTVPDCDDGIDCTDDVCNEGMDACDHNPDDAFCANGDFCDGEEVCNASTGCDDGIAPECSDGVACTIDTCNEATDECDHATSDVACSNGEYCDGAETCDAVNDCQPGTAIDCDDGVGCTLDSCYEIGDVCTHTPSDGACSDGLYCTGDETCDSVNDCQPGTPVVCADAFTCTVDTCNETTDDCDFAPDDALCSDGNFCSGVEICDEDTGCETGANPCIGLQCDEVDNICVGCLSDNDCDDDDACNGLETCVMDNCVPGTPMDCDDGIECTEDSCSGDACVNAPSNALCSNGDYCDGSETCDPMLDCQAGTPPDCGDGVDCTIDTCNETTNSCDHATSDALCDNGDYCDGDETCDAVNDCQRGTNVDCDDGVSCTADTCNESTDECDNTPDNAPCSNGALCDGVEVCDEITGCEPAVGPLDCDDGISCTSDSCDQNLGCLNTPSNGACDNMLYCDGVETCNPQGGCEPGTTVDCADSVTCTVDSCDEATDLCTHTADDALCDNGQYCDGVETCNAMTDCVSGNPVVCADQIICTTNSCNEATDNCTTDFSTCVCGDTEVTGTEECDPPAPAGSYEDCNDLADNDADGRADCRDRDCRPGARLPLCDESCTMDQVCARFIRDPAHIQYGTEFGPDELYIHGRIPMTGEKLRSAVHAVTFQLSNPLGPIYRASLDEGDMRGGIAERRYRFRDTQARYLGDRSARGGLEKVSVRTRRFGGVKFLVFTIRAYGDFSKARHRMMTTELSVGPEIGYLTMEWKATSRGWVLHQKNFAGPEPFPIEEE